MKPPVHAALEVVPPGSVPVIVLTGGRWKSRCHMVSLNADWYARFDLTEAVSGVSVRLDCLWRCILDSKEADDRPGCLVDKR